jgi:hypothetical protein
MIFQFNSPSGKKSRKNVRFDRSFSAPTAGDSTAGSKIIEPDEQCDTEETSGEEDTVQHFNKFQGWLQNMNSSSVGDKEKDMLAVLLTGIRGILEDKIVRICLFVMNNNY